MKSLKNNKKYAKYAYDERGNLLTKKIILLASCNVCKQLIVFLLQTHIFSFLKYVFISFRKERRREER